MKKILTIFLILFIVPCSNLYAQGTRSQITSRVASKKTPSIVLENQIATLYQCELGNKLTTYTDETDDSYINLRWKGKIYRLDRKETTTGAERYENTKNGLVLVNIPTKSMLLDSKKGRQLANECRNQKQLALME